MMENNTCGTLLVCCECVCVCVCMQEIVQLLEITGFSRISVEKSADEPGTGRHECRVATKRLFLPAPLSTCSMLSLL